MRLNFGWVIPGRLAGAQGPAALDDLQYFKQQGIKAIVRMEQRTISGEGLGLVDLYEPVPDFGVPEMSHVARMVDFIHEHLENRGQPVVVTCFAGLGRTGTLLACYLVHLGHSPESAVTLVRRLRPGSVQTRLQEMAVYQYAASPQNRP